MTNNTKLNFEYNYSKRMDVLLATHSLKLDKHLNTLLQNAKLNYELTEDVTLKKIKACCSQQSKKAADLLLKATIDMAELYEDIVANETLWAIFLKKVSAYYDRIDEKKATAIKAAQGANFCKRLVDASSLKDTYKSYLQDARKKLYFELESLNQRKKIRRRTELLNRLKGYWIYGALVGCTLITISIMLQRISV